MVYGRYNELDNYGIHGLCKPTNITGVPIKSYVMLVTVGFPKIVSIYIYYVRYIIFLYI